MNILAFYCQLSTARNFQLGNEVRWGIEIEADEIQIGCKRLIHASSIFAPYEYYLARDLLCANSPFLFYFKVHASFPVD